MKTKFIPRGDMMFSQVETRKMRRANAKAALKEMNKETGQKIPMNLMWMQIQLDKYGKEKLAYLRSTCSPNTTSTYFTNRKILSEIK